MGWHGCQRQRRLKRFCLDLYLPIKRRTSNHGKRNRGNSQMTYLFDFLKTMELLKNDNFRVRKWGVRVGTYDKPFYNRKDKQDLEEMREFIRSTFVERGTRTTKKQIL